MAQIRGLGDLRPTMATVGAYLDALEDEHDPVRLGDIVTVLSYAGTAALSGHSDLELRYLRAQLLEVAHVALLQDRPPCRRVPWKEADELPAVATLIDMVGVASLPPNIGDY